MILKSSELCPATHRLIGDVLQQAGLPPGVVNIVSNAPEDAQTIVSTLIAHPAVKRINFTGSTRVGRVIAKLAAEHLKPTLLELGGKAPLVVLDDADIEEEAVRVTNDTEYGLSAAVFTRNINRALRVASGIESGICHINGPTVHDEAQMPFGGVKQSGYGRFGGRWGVSEFTEVRWISIGTQQGRYPI